MLTRVIINVQNSLAATGAKGAGGLAAQFRSMDKDGDGALTSAEFAEGLKKAGVKVRPVDVAALFQATDANKRGRPPRVRRVRRTSSAGRCRRTGVVW